MESRFLLALAFAGLTVALRAQPPVVHEWGTFTSLQDENGRTLSGINTDDEPMPLWPRGCRIPNITVVACL